MIPIWIAGPCLRCGACVGTCPVGAMGLKENGILIDRRSCTGCGTCIRICPVASIEEGE